MTLNFCCCREIWMLVAVLQTAVQMDRTVTVVVVVNLALIWILVAVLQTAVQMDRTDTVVVVVNLALLLSLLLLLVVVVHNKSIISPPCRSPIRFGFRSGRGHG